MKRTRKIPNTRKQLDLNKYNPQALVKRGLSGKVLRAIYSDFRGVAKKRIAALIAKGFGNVEEVRRSYFPTLKEISKKPNPDYYLKAKIYELAQFLNNPLSLLRNQANRTEIKTINTLRSHGYDVAADSQISFGKFMQLIKSRGIGLMLDSKRAVQYYEEHYLEGMTYKEIAESFEKWQNKEIKIIIDNMKLLYPDEWKQRLNDRGIDYEAYKRGSLVESGGIRSTNSSGSRKKKKPKRK